MDSLIALSVHQYGVSTSLFEMALEAQEPHLCSPFEFRGAHTGGE